METKQLSTNGYHVTNIFDEQTLNELITLADTFTPTSIRTTTDAPGLSMPIEGSNREVFFIDGGPVYHKLVNRFFNPRPYKSSIEIWRDYPGYRNLWHYDFAYVENVLIIYLDGAGGANMGTAFRENGNEYVVEYRKNSGLLLLNSNKVEHAMVGEVADVPYRKVLYINWTNNGS